MSAGTETSAVRVEPMDAHNEKLVDHVHPASWTNPEPQSRYHLVCVGAGAGGLISAAIAAGLGAKVALIERHLMGGDCLNVGCVPSKGVISAARSWKAAAQSHEKFAGPQASGSGDFAKAMERMRRLRAGISHVDSVQRFADLGIDVFLGHANFTSANTIDVGGTELKFRKAVVATGARAAVPPIPGLEDVEYLTNESVFSLTDLPARMVVVGAGPIGCEMAQSFSRFGSEVTILDRADHVLPREDGDAAAVVQKSMEEDGVKYLGVVSITRVEERDGEKVIHYERDGRSEEIATDRLLIAIGRAPNVDLGLEKAGVKYDTRKGVEVDAELRTSAPNIFAVGDVCSALKFTHLADAHARMVVQNALFFGHKKTTDLVVP
ncbi:MAG: FAD-dependent oxidoreductase, partial [Planctomycetota bacterium]